MNYGFEIRNSLDGLLKMQDKWSLICCLYLTFLPYMYLEEQKLAIQVPVFHKGPTGLII